MRKPCAWIVLISLAVSMASAAAENGDELKEAELERLLQVLNAEKDPASRAVLNRQISQLDNELDQHAVVELHDAWIKETDPEKKKHIGDQLAEVAVHLKNFAEDTDDEAARRALNIIVEVATNGTFHQKQINNFGKPEAVPLRLIRSFKPEPAQWADTAAWVIRRMTSDRFEVWLPHHGWLFDSTGRLINEARPPRRDGLGRQWYGAFLPDGRWVTTDLWEMDRTLHFFSRDGKWEKDIFSDILVPRKTDNDRSEPSLIGWCRCDRSGKGFVLDVGATGGRGVAFVTWAGNHRILKDDREAWKLCYQRDLEPKGAYTFLFVPDDRRKLRMTRQEDGHGPDVGYPVYEAGKVNARIPDGDSFGFWPCSKNVYIVTKTTSWVREPFGDNHEGPAIIRTWFYNADGQFAGWIDGERLADSASMDAMLFLDGANRVITLNKKYRTEGTVQFVMPNGTTAKPYKIFPDLRIGFFIRGKELALASW